MLVLILDLFLRTGGDRGTVSGSSFMLHSLEDLALRIDSSSRAGCVTGFGSSLTLCWSGEPALTLPLPWPWLELLPGDRGSLGVGLLLGEHLKAEGQQCRRRHEAHRGPTGRHTCWPNPTSSQLISLQRSLWGGRHRKRALRLEQPRPT